MTFCVILCEHSFANLNFESRFLQVQIGDHQQLRPGTNVHELVLKFKFDVSIFERLAKRDFPCVQLSTQRRMRPEIAGLMRLFYPYLRDHDSVFGECGSSESEKRGKRKGGKNEKKRHVKRKGAKQKSHTKYSQNANHCERVSSHAYHMLHCTLSGRKMVPGMMRPIFFLDHHAREDDLRDNPDMRSKQVLSCINIV